MPLAADRCTRPANPRPATLSAFGPLSVGSTLSGDWQLAFVLPAGERVRLGLVDLTGGREVVLWTTSQDATHSANLPFGHLGGAPLNYERTELDRLALSAATRALQLALGDAADVEVWIALALASSCDGKGGHPARKPVSPSPWQQQARERLTDRRGESVQLGDLISAADLPQRACTLPWTYLEVSNEFGDFAPCCFDYPVQRARAPLGTPVAALWNHPSMQRFREAMVAGEPGRTCRTTCPRWNDGSATLDRLVLHGGSAALIQAQIEAVEAILAGRTVLDTPPATLHCRPTTFCNYDCLMCSCGETGTLADELPRAFYDAVLDLPVGLHHLDLSGGEPLASPVLRDLLTTCDFSKYPDLMIFLVTNGSYLTPRLQQALWRPGGPRLSLVVSLNAATPATYRKVHRGLPFSRIRAHLDLLLAARRDGRMQGSLRYSMVLLQSNHHEIEAFVDLAVRDGVGFRLMLPQYDRNAESILTREPTMRATLSALQRVVAQYGEHPLVGDSARIAQGCAQIIAHRLKLGLFQPIPDP
jgi:molybdenum cofactor biosynthesis enzyme MoaA